MGKANRWIETVPDKHILRSGTFQAHKVQLTLYIRKPSEQSSSMVILRYKNDVKQMGQSYTRSVSILNYEN